MLIIWCLFTLPLNVSVVLFQLADVSCYVPQLSSYHKFRSKKDQSSSGCGHCKEIGWAVCRVLYPPLLRFY